MTTKYWEHDLGTARRPINTLYAKKIKVENETNAKNINFDTLVFFHGHPVFVFLYVCLDLF